MGKVARDRGLRGAALLLAALLLAGCAAKYELGGPIPPVGEAEAMTAFLMSELRIEPEQRSTVYRWVKESAQKKQRINQTMRGRPLEQREMQSNRLRMLHDAIEDLLVTDKQREKWDYIYGEIRENELEPMRNQAAPPRNPNQHLNGNGGSPYGY